MEMSQTIGAIAKALSQFQAEVKQPKKDAKNPHFGSKYVPLEGIISAITEPMAKYGLSYLQNASSDGQDAVVSTIVMHESGEWIKTDPLSLPAFQTLKGGAKEFNAQGAGSAITYAKRYQLGAALGIASEDDDDGNEATGAGRTYSDAKPSQSANNTRPNQQSNPPQNKPQTGATSSSDVASEKQVGFAKKLIKEKFVPNDIVFEALRSYGVERIDQIPKAKASEFIKFLESWETPQPLDEKDIPF